MRTALAAFLLCSSFCFCQSATKKTQSPQTARQALIEMFFGDGPNHLERHLPEVTRHSFNKFGAPGGDNYLSEVSRIAAQIRSGAGKFETFDAGPTLVSATDVSSGDGPDRIEVTLERDDLIGDEDQIELALRLSRNGKEMSLPVIPRVVFSMQSAAGVWRLNEVSATVRMPLTDPNFLKTVEDDQRTRYESRAMWSVQQVNMAETGFSNSQGHFACSLALLGKPIGEGESAITYLYNPPLAKGSVDGYVFAITGCDATHYKIAGEPAAANTGLRAFCSDESGEMRASADGKATSCLSRGVMAQEAAPEQAPGEATSK